MNNNTRLGYAASAAQTSLPACGEYHMLIVKRAAKSIPIKQSCSTVSETVLSFRDSHEDICNIVLFQGPNIFCTIKEGF